MPQGRRGLAKKDPVSMNHWLDLPFSRRIRPGKGSWGALILFLFFMIEGCGGYPNEGRPIPYNIFRDQLNAGNIKEVTLSGDRILGRFRKALREDGSAGEPDARRWGGLAGDREVGQSPASLFNFQTTLPSVGDAQLFPLLEQQKVGVMIIPPRDSGWKEWGFLPLLILLGIGIIVLWRLRMQMRGGTGMLPLTPNRARLYRSDGKKTTFSDVAGAEAPKRELKEAVEFLRNPQHFQRLGGKMPKGALLMGPPGTGKTLLARAVAGEANVPFFSISGSDFMEMYVGMGASRVRNLFREAKKVAPSIIFIDELDSIGRHRGLGLGGGHDEREQTLNQLLSEMDGFEINDSVVVIAATNRPDILDPALIRPGRFDRHIAVDLPSFEDRLAILKTHARGKPLDNAIDLARIARGTPGFSGADLENLLNEASIQAARNDKKSIEEQDLQEAWDKVIMGLERKSLAVSEEERKLLAYHEGGHAVVAAVLPNTDPVYKVTIIPRGRAMGVTQQLPEREKYIYPKEYLLDRLAVMLGGRAAEALVFGTSTTGAEQDLKQAMNLARKMVLDWGMSEKLRNLALGGEREQYMEGVTKRGEFSETTAAKVDEEVATIIDEAFRTATDTLAAHRQGLNRLAQMLIEKEEVPGSEVIELVKEEEEG